MDSPQEDSATLSARQSPEKKDDHLVSLDASEDPLRFSTLKKWLAVAVICGGSFCVTCASSMVRRQSALVVCSLTVRFKASFTEIPMAAEFHVSREPTILTISLFVLGLGVGPLITGPFSEACPAVAFLRTYLTS
jgi:hypothetical protein